MSQTVPKGESRIGLMVLGACIAIGLATGGYFVGQTMYNAKVAINTAQAKGLAERRVRADRATWDIGFSVSGPSRDKLPQLYTRAEAHQITIVKLLQDAGLSDSEIDRGILNHNHQVFRGHDQSIVDQVHQISGSVRLDTEKVAEVSRTRGRVSKLIAEGIDVQNGRPVYRFSKLNDIKPDMLREATKNARIAASEFASNAGVRVGGIRSARQGGFFVRDAGEEYGDTAKIAKDVRVVTTIEFYLTH